MYKTLDLKCKPSSVLSIEDEYTSYCFDEMISNIISRISNGDEVVFTEKKSVNNSYKNFSDVYNKYE